MQIIKKNSNNDTQNFHHGVGRRKTAIAVVRLYPSNAKKDIIVNDQKMEEYFDLSRWQNIVTKSLTITEHLNNHYIVCKIIGGGKSAQADALSLALSRALEKLDNTLRSILKSNGLLTRDSRKKERKKPGHDGARALFQYGKR